MGDVADMMLDGTLDAETGEYIGEPCGYPRVLHNGKAIGQFERYANNQLPPAKIACPQCGKQCGGEHGLAMHKQAKHPAT